MTSNRFTKTNALRILFPLIPALFLMGCSEVFEYSPNQKFDRSTPVDLNSKNLQRLMDAPKDDTTTLVLVGDSQRFYDELDQFVLKVNTFPNVDMILLAGDASDFGLHQEFKWVYRSLSKLTKPYFAVIGNHDTVGNGDGVFQEMFGPLNSSFIYHDIKFILHNTNSLEYPDDNVPDMAWLENELKPAESIQYYIGVSHVPPFGDGGEFNIDLEKKYASLLQSTPGFLLSLHGHVHEHRDYYPYDDGIRYITCASFEQRSFILLKIVKGQVLKTIVQY